MSIAEPTPEQGNITPMRTVKGGAWLSDRETLRQIGGTLGSSALGVYVTLETYANRQGECWPSQDTLADELRLTARQVRRHLNALEEAGWIQRKPRFNRYGYQKGTLYLLTHHPKSDETPRTNGADMAPDITPDMMEDMIPDTVPDMVGVENVLRSTRSTGSKRSTGTHSARESSQLRQNAPADQIIQAFCDAVQIEQPADLSRARGHAQKLVDAGVPSSEVPRLIQWMRSNTWFRDKIRIDMLSRAYDQWRAERDAPVNSGPPPESFSTSTPWHLRNIERPDLIGPARMAWEKERYRQRMAQQGATHAGS